MRVLLLLLLLFNDSCKNANTPKPVSSPAPVGSEECRLLLNKKSKAKAGYKAASEKRKETYASYIAVIKGSSRESVGKSSVRVA